MYHKLHLLLNIKIAETQVVKQLFLVQFFLGIATAFLFTSSLAMFLHAFEVSEIPKVYMASAALLLGANVLYAKLEALLTPKVLLQTIILFSGFSLLFTWAGLFLFEAKWLLFALSAWNVVVYMLVSYAFWGIAAIIFNVREGKRLFSVVGSGEIPAKMLGYTAVSVLAPWLGVANLLWFSIGGFALAFFFLKKFDHYSIMEHVGHSEQQDNTHIKKETFIVKYFHNHLILSIAFFSAIGFTIYSLVDYTLLAEVKSKFYSTPQLAAFIGMFFAVGRVLAILIKLVLSSRVLSRLGITNSLLIAPVVLLAISVFMLLPLENELTLLYIFGVMVLFSEVLKSAVQEPAFFVLFQPLDSHSRLRGHLIAKGYTMPFALLLTGMFLFGYSYFNGSISIVLVSQILVGLLVAWIISIFLVKKEYLRALVNAIKKGYLTGSELLLQDEPVKKLLLQKVASKKPKEVLLALELLERSGYSQMESLLLPLLQDPSEIVRRYVLSRVVALKLTNAFPIIEQVLQDNQEDAAKTDYTTAYFFLIPHPTDFSPSTTLVYKKAALVGLSLRTEEAAHQIIQQHLTALGKSSLEEERLVALEVHTKAPHPDFLPLLKLLLEDSSDTVVKRAIETVGKTKAVSLLPTIISVGKARKALYALQRALVLFGDEIFSPHHFFDGYLRNDLRLTVIKAAGKVKGETSTKFLRHLLKKEQQYKDQIIEALWSKNANLLPDGKELVEAWVKAKLSQSRRKMRYCLVLSHEPGLSLLSASLCSEVKQDVQKILKSLALLYDRLRINRVIGLFSKKSDHKMDNAIEMLEHLIPKRYFVLLEPLLDFQLEKEKRSLRANNRYPIDGRQIIREIVTDNPAGCSAWVTGMACYSILASPTPELAEALTSERMTSPDDFLFNETRSFVLTQLAKSEICY